MINNLQEFHYYIGEAIMFCQCIEIDIKLIYAGMLDGVFHENYKGIKKWPLGKTVKELEELDYSDRDPYFDRDEYAFLKKITNIRNYLAHEAYTFFVYENNSEFERKFEKAIAKLEREHERLSKVHKTVEKARLDFLRSYNRL